jgi:Mrp family chromosome partitioning ATPase
MESDGKTKTVTSSNEETKVFENMNKIRHKILVMSGKGGVGKSTVAVNLALALAMRGFETGILDVDIHGPNIPKMLNVEDAVLTGESKSLCPIIVPPNLRVMSMGFLLSSRDTPVIWRGPMKMGVIRQFLGDVKWGPLDYLVIDLPPGTGDEPLSIAQLIPEADGVVVVTTPQDVALLDSRKSVMFAKAVKLPMIGIVENMSSFECPHCGKEIELFKSGGGERAAKQLGVPFLGRVPFDSKVVLSGDDGIPIVLAHPDSPGAKALTEIVDMIVKKTGGSKA